MNEITKGGIGADLSTINLQTNMILDCMHLFKS